MSPVVLLMISIFLVLAVSGGLVAVGLSRALGGEGELRERIQVYAAIPELNPRRADRRSTRVSMLRLRINSMLSAFTSEKLAWQLLSANWPVTPVEFILIRISATVAAFLFATLAFRSPLAGIGLAVIAYLLPGILLARAINGRRLKFERQLVDVLVLINGAVRAGFSLLQAMEVVVREMKAPASEEFERVTHEVGLGLSMGDALGNLARRMQNRDLDLMVAAVNIHYQVGGNLSVILAAVSETIRDRIRLFAEVRVITTQQRYTSYLLSLLPFFVGGVLFFISPEYMQGLFDPRYLCIPIGALIGIVLGYFVIRRLGRIEV